MAPEVVNSGAKTKEPENEVRALLYRHFQLETKEIHISSGTRTPGKSGEQAQGDVETGDGHGTEKPTRNSVRTRSETRRGSSS